MEPKESYKHIQELYEKEKQNAADVAAKMLDEPDEGLFWVAVQKHRDTLALVCAKYTSDITKTLMEELHSYGVMCFGLGYYAKEAEILERQVDDVVNGK